jgi:hypothetical protein
LEGRALGFDAAIEFRSLCHLQVSTRSD